MHGDMPAGTSIDMSVRGATTAGELANTAWQAVNADGTVNISNINYLQIKLVLQSARVNVTPSINYISINKIGLE